MTDEANQYTEVGKRFAKHGQVDHSREEYAYFDRQTKTIVSVNCAEGYFSIFKRGMVGIYQHCSEKAFAPLSRRVRFPLLAPHQDRI